MSVPTAEAPSDAPSAQPQARPLTVLGIAIGLATIGAVAALFVSMESGPAEGRVEFEKLFEPAELPFAMTLDGAVVLPGGARAIVFVDRAAEPEAPKSEVSAAEGAPTPDATPVDWKKVAIGEPGRPPRRVVFLTDPSREGIELLGGESGHQGVSEVRHLGPDGGLVHIELGKLPWDAFNADFVHERRYERGGTFCDAIRTNLSANGRSCWMLAEWSRGFPGSKERVAEILKVLRPKPRVTEPGASAPE